mmetsp:Transcript_118631/g.215599  ORF Transcript_118631/g.215599 Transcript_118631/m.215599 type:complete len:211 (+) Transcript_118631:231-863(+)
MALFVNVPREILSTRLHVVLVVHRIEEVQSLSDLGCFYSRLSTTLNVGLHVGLDVVVAVRRLLIRESLQCAFRGALLHSPTLRPRRCGLAQSPSLCDPFCFSCSCCLFVSLPEVLGDVWTVIHTLPIRGPVQDCLDIGRIVPPRLRVVVLAHDAKVLRISTLPVRTEVQVPAEVGPSINVIIVELGPMDVAISKEFRFGSRHCKSRSGWV